MLAPEDIAAIETWLNSTLVRCQRFRAKQLHELAETCAEGALKFLRDLRRAEAKHGFSVGLIGPPENAFVDFVADERRAA